MAKTYRTGLVITGDASDGVKAINLTRDQLDKLNRTGKQTRTQMRETTAEGERFTASLGTMAHKAAAWGAAFVGVNAIMGQFNQQLDSVDRIHKLNLRIGASTEALSEYAYVAELSGTNIEQLAVAWQRQTRRIAEAAQGTGVAKAALEELNLSATDLRTLAPEDQFMAIAGALENVAEKGDRLRLANAIFDSEGAAAALQIINQGTDAMERMIERAQKLGATVFQDQANNIASYNDAITDMRYAWEGVNRVLAANIAESATDGLIELAEVIPAVTNAIEYLDEVMIATFAVMAGKGSGALVKYTQKQVERIKTTRAVAQSEVLLAKQMKLRAVQDEAAARQALAVAASTSERKAARKQLTAAVEKSTAAQKNLNVVTTNYQRTATLAGRAATGLKSAMAFFGGPLGVVTLAVTAFSLLSPRLRENKNEAVDLSAHVRELTRNIEELTLAQAEQRLQNEQAPYEEAAKRVREYAAQVAYAMEEIERVTNKPESIIAGPGGLTDEERLLEQERLLKVWQRRLVDAKGNLSTATIELGEFDKAMRQLNDRINRLNAGQADQAGRVAVTSQAYAELNAKLDDVARINQDYYEIVQEITELDDTHAKKQELLAKAAEKRTRALEQLNKKQSSGVKVTENLSESNDKAAASYAKLKAEIDDTARINQSYYEYVNTVINSELDLAQKHEFIALAAEKRTKAISALHSTQKEGLSEVTAETNVWAEITENAVNSVDDSFRDLFRSGLEGWDDFWDQMQDTTKDMLAELAYTLAKEQLWVNVGMNVTGQSGGVGAVTAMAGQGGSLMSNASSLIQNGSTILRNGLDFFNPSSGYTTMAVNQTAASMGYGFAADGMGPPVALVDSGGYVAQGLNAVGPGLAAYGMAQKYGPLGGVAGGVGSAALAGGISGALGGTGFMSGAATALGAINPIGWAAIGIGALLGGLEKEPSNKEGRTIVDLASGESTIGGQSGDKRDDENRDASAQIAAVFSDTVIPLLNQYGTNTIGGSYVVGVGDRDPLRFHYDSVADGDSDWEYGTGRNNSQGHSYDTRIAGNTRDPEKFIGSVTEFLAEQAGINTAFFNELADEGEQFYETLHRIETQFAVLSEVDLFADLSGVAGEAGKRAADTLAESIYTELGTAQESQLETLLRVSNAWAVVTGTAEQLNQSLDVTGMAALEAATNIVELAGGVEALANGSSFYYQNYFTEQERAQDQVDAYTSMLDEFNAEFGTALNGREDLRAYVESLDLTSEAGQQAYVAAMELAPALVELEQALTVVNEPARLLAERGKELQASVDDVVWGWMSSEQQLSAYRSQIQDFNTELGLSGAVAIESREELTQYLTSLDLSTQAGQDAASSALKLVDAVTAVTEANQTAVASEQALADERLSAARSTLESTLQSNLSSLTQQQSALESTAADAKRQLVSALRQEISDITAMEAELQQRAEGARLDLVGALEREIAAAQAHHDGLRENLDNARAAYSDAIDSEISALNSQINAQQNARAEAQSTAQAWLNAADSLADARADLLADTWSPEQSRVGSKNSFDEALAGAWGGSIEAFKALPQLAQDAQAAARNTSATGTDYRLATAQLAAQLDSAGGLANTKASAQEQLIAAADEQLRTLESQLQGLESQQASLLSIDAHALNISAASQAFYQAQSEYQADDSATRALRYSEQLAALQAVDTDLLSIAEAQQALSHAERALSSLHHTAQLNALTDELEELEGVNANLVALDAARNQYESAALNLARSTFTAEIAVMQQQLTWLQQLNASVLSLPEAIAAYESAGGEALPQFANGGIASGPTSGYPVELHGTEAVIPLKSGAVPVSISDGGMGAELRALRAAVAQLNDDLRRIGGQQIKSAQKVESILKKFDIGGVDVRVAS